MWLTWRHTPFRILPHGGYPLVYKCFGAWFCYQAYSFFRNHRKFCNWYGALQLFGWWPSRHLLGINKRKEARTVIAQLNSVPEGDALVDDMIEELDFGIRAENEGGKATWLECFSTRNVLWKRTLNGMMLQFIQQLNGQNFYCELEKFSGVH